MKVRKNRLEGLIALLLFGVFAVCILIVLLTGANTYHRLTDSGREAYDRRTSVHYIATQIRKADCADCVSIVSFGDGNALSLAQNIDGESYVTLIYIFDGYLMELFCSGPDDMSPEDGEQVMPISALDVSMSENTVSISCLDDKNIFTSLDLSLRSGKEAGA